MTSQNTNEQLFHQINFHQIKSKMAADNMSNIHVSPNVLLALMALQQENLRKLQQQILHGISRSSRPELFRRKAALKSYVEFTRKHPCWSFFLIKMQDGDAWNFIKKRLQHRYFPVKFAKFLRTPILKSICERLLLHLKYFSKQHCWSCHRIWQNSNSRGRNIVWNWGVLFSWKFQI